MVWGVGLLKVEDLGSGATEAPTSRLTELLESVCSVDSSSLGSF